MASTYEPIATTTLSSSAANITFSSIPSTYTDLVLIISGSNTNSGTNNLGIQFDSDTSSNYSATRILGDGGSVSSGRISNQSYAMIGDTNTALFTSIVHIMNYSNTTTYKTFLSRTGNASAYLGAYVGLWRNTSAITSLLVYNPSGNVSSGTTATIYGIKAA